MKSSFLLMVVVLTGINYPTMLRAQATGADQAPNAESRQHQILGFLPAAEQDRVIHAYNKAMTDNPDLKSDQEDLQKGREQLAEASDGVREAYLKMVESYKRDLRADMIKADATLGPILDKIDQHRVEMAAHGGQDDGGSGR